MDQATIQQIIEFPFTSEHIKSHCDELLERGIVTMETVMQRPTSGSDHSFARTIAKKHGHYPPKNRDDRFVIEMIEGVCWSVPNDGDRRTLEGLALQPGNDYSV